MAPGAGEGDGMVWRGGVQVLAGGLALLFELIF